MKLLHCVRLFGTPWTIGYQAPLSMGFSRQEYWSGLPFPSPEDLPDPGIEPGSPALQADALTSEPAGKPRVYSRGLEMYMGRREQGMIDGICGCRHNLGKKSKVRLCGTLNFMTVTVEPFL